MNAEHEFTISIDRSSRTYAIFDAGVTIVRDFQSYESEEVAIIEAKIWIKERSSVEPRIVYPRITRMRAW